jgi:1,4-dihydroxy-2-naphthoyl-CoA hydrolase
MESKMSLWFKNVSAAELNQLCVDTLVSFLGITIDEVHPDGIVGSMPVSNNIKQPYGIVHGGANCVLAESLGSLAANLTLDQTQFHAVGLNINTSHIKAVRNGKVTGRTHNIHKGKTTQIWEIKTFNDANQLTSISTLTMAIIQKLNS